MEFDRPQSRNEAILQNMLGASNLLEPPQSRVEALLQAIAGQMPEANPSEGTTTGTLDRLKIGDEIYSVEGGGGGTTNYNDLSNQPQIGGVTLQGNKTASDLGLASEEDLEEKQDVLTAGNYVSITNDGTINVTKAIGVYDRVRYVFTPEGGGYYMRVEVYINDVKRFEQQYQNTAVFNHVVIMELVEFWYGGDGYYWHYKPLIDSREHAKDIVISWYYTEMDVHEETFDVPQDDSTTLATKGDVEYAIDTIKDGQSIDSFADVESALADKQDKTDDKLQTTDKTIVGGINELKSSLTSLLNAFSSLGLSVVNGKVCQTYKTN